MILKITRLTVYVMCITVLFTSCKHKNTEEQQNNYVMNGDTITIPRNSALQYKLKLITVTSSNYSQQLLTAGTVKAIPTKYAEISSPFPGRVTSSWLRLGAKTTPETPLFAISSADFINAQKIYFQEKSQLEQARKTLKRQQDLLDNGVGTQKDLEEAQTAFNVELREYENAVMSIKIFKADPDKLVLGQPLVIYAPVDGEVIENKVVTGQFIKDDGVSIAAVADLSKVWIAAQVKEKDIRFIHEKDDCQIEIAALPGVSLQGKVYHINEIVEDATRSVEVLIECKNANLRLKPGMYVNINFSAVPEQVIMVPSKALLQMNGSSFVFVVSPGGKYSRRKVETGETNAGKVLIKSGLQNGDTLVSEGGFYLLEAR